MILLYFFYILIVNGPIHFLWTILWKKNVSPALLIAKIIALNINFEILNHTFIAYSYGLLP